MHTANTMNMIYVDKIFKTFWLIKQNEKAMEEFDEDMKEGILNALL